AAMALGACGDAALAEAVGEAVGRAVKSLGFNWDFAPVLDVNNNPANPVIAERSFSEDPAEVTRLAGAWMRGALRAGVACCVKHFPGHGDTHVDSHRDLPIVDKPLAELQALEFVPFHALRAEAPAMMTAHIVYPQLDPEHPATLSRKVLGGLLRDAWGYDGVVITDSLVMKAIHDRYGHDRAAVLALQAGADMVMALGTQDEQLAAIRAIQRAQASGDLGAEKLAKANARLDRLAARYPVRHADYAPAQHERDDDLMHRAWAAGLTTRGTAPVLRRDHRLRVFTQRAVPSDGVSEAGLPGVQVAELFGGFASVDMVELDALAELDWSTIPRDGRLNVVVSNHRDRYDTRAKAWRADLHVVLWNPYQAL
ncbi:MAG: beta-N-acetylhexosaminidase, partial [Massilia sp.]|nr:beta-N-acetylhexosaminidase [Massilia sp.]